VADRLLSRTPLGRLAEPVGHFPGGCVVRRCWEGRRRAGVRLFVCEREWCLPCVTCSDALDASDCQSSKRLCGPQLDSLCIWDVFPLASVLSSNPQAEDTRQSNRHRDLIVAGGIRTCNTLLSARAGTLSCQDQAMHGLGFHFE